MDRVGKAGGVVSKTLWLEGEVLRFLGVAPEPHQISCFFRGHVLEIRNLQGRSCDGAAKVHGGSSLLGKENSSTINQDCLFIEGVI